MLPALPFLIAHWLYEHFVRQKSVNVPINNEPGTLRISMNGVVERRPRDDGAGGGAARQGGRAKEDGAGEGGLRDDSTGQGSARQEDRAREDRDGAGEGGPRDDGAGEGAARQENREREVAEGGPRDVDAGKVTAGKLSLMEVSARGCRAAKGESKGDNTGYNQQIGNQRALECGVRHHQNTVGAGNYRLPRRALECGENIQNMMGDLLSHIPSPQGALEYGVNIRNVVGMVSELLSRLPSCALEYEVNIPNVVGMVGQLRSRLPLPRCALEHEQNMVGMAGVLLRPCLPSTGRTLEYGQNVENAVLLCSLLSRALERERYPPASLHIQSVMVLRALECIVNIQSTVGILLLYFSLTRRTPQYDRNVMDVTFSPSLLPRASEHNMNFQTMMGELLPYLPLARRAWQCDQNVMHTDVTCSPPIPPRALEHFQHNLPPPRALQCRPNAAG